MDWYYVRDGKQMGPVGDAEFETLVQQGVVNGTTLVWNAEMPDWQRYEDLGASVGAGGAHGSHACAECGVTFSLDDMVPFQDLWVCGRCKPVFVQRIREGAAMPTAFFYAGFWIRVVSSCIDFVIVLIAGMALGYFFGQSFTLDEMPASFWLYLTMFGGSILNNVMVIAYMTFFIGKYGATPGKMACGLKVIRPDGESVSYLRAFARYFAKSLSGMLLCIGYLMVAYDEEKRGLHDRLCDTRVIYT